MQKSRNYSLKTQIIQPFWFVFTFVLRSFPFFPFLANSNPFGVRSLFFYYAKRN